MKHTVKKAAAFLVILTLAIAMLCIGASAAESDAEKNASGFSFSALTEDIQLEFSEATIIGTYCQQFFDFLETNRDYHYIALGVLALILCFFGYRLLRLFLLVVGFIGGCYGGFILYPHVASWIPSAPSYVELIVAAVFGIAGAILIHFLFRVAIVAGVGYGVFLLSAPYFVDVPNALLYRIVVSVVIAIVAALLLKVAFVFATGLGGGLIAVAQLGSRAAALGTVLYENEAVFSYLEPIGVPALTVGVAIGLFVGLLGILFQFANTRRRRA